MRLFIVLSRLYKKCIYAIVFLIQKSLLALSPNGDKIIQVLDKITQSGNITIQIDYREPLFEKSIGRTEDKPYTVNRTIKTSNVFEAITEALSIFFHNETNSGVHWRSEIVGLKVHFNLKEDQISEN